MLAQSKPDPRKPVYGSFLAGHQTLPQPQGVDQLLAHMQAQTNSHIIAQVRAEVRAEVLVQAETQASQMQAQAEVSAPLTSIL